MEGDDDYGGLTLPCPKRVKLIMNMLMNMMMIMVVISKGQ